MRISVHISGIDRIRENFARIAQAPQRALDATAVKVEEYIDTQIAPHTKTGALERSLGKRPSPGGWEIGHDSRVASYARWVHDGTKPHVIMARAKKALRYARDGIFWFWFGPKPKEEQGRIRAWVRKHSGPSARVVFRWPKHPGTKPDRWIDRAAAQAPLIFRAQLEAQIARSVKE